jgi:hypothetical protein
MRGPQTLLSTSSSKDVYSLPPQTPTSHAAIIALLRLLPIFSKLDAPADGARDGTAANPEGLRTQGGKSVFDSPQILS